MHIVHVTEAWNGGVATYVNTLLREQAKQPEITALSLLHSRNMSTRGFDPGFYREHNITTIAYDSSRNPAQFWPIAQKIRSHLQRIKPDIVHLHSSFAGLYGRLLPHDFKIIYCAHGWSFTQENLAIKRKLYAGAENLLSRRTQAIINISDYERRAAERAGIDAPIHITLPNAVNDAAAAAIAEFKPNPDVLNLGFIGRLDPKKGFDLLAPIFTGALCKIVNLHVFGMTADEAKAANLPTGPVLHYHGWIENTELDSYIAKLDAIIIPSRFEGFGLAAIEAMCNAKPVIVSNRGGLPELIKDGQNGFVFDLDQIDQALPAIIKTLNKNRLAVMGKNARRFYEDKFTSRRLAEDTLQLYCRVLSAT